MEKQIKKTPLHKWHMENKANMVAFGNYEMPLWYESGVKKEHMAVIEEAGLFDTSHMDSLIIKGPESFDLLQTSFTRDLNACAGKSKGRLLPGGCVYGLFLDENGHTIDDAIVYRMDENVFLTVVNSGMGGKISDHLTSHFPNKNIEVISVTNHIGKMDIQGPNAGKILMKMLMKPDKVLKYFPYFSFKGSFDPSDTSQTPVYLTGDVPVLLSRTGYTGEFGFELFLEKEKIPGIWLELLSKGKDLGLIPCGLAARDSLRAGAMLPLSHQDIGNWPFINTPWDIALPYAPDKKSFTKPFIGSDALTAIKKTEYTVAFAGYDLRKISAEDISKVLNDKGETIGKVLTCVTDMAIGRHDGNIYSTKSPGRPEKFIAKGLSCGFLKSNVPLACGDVVELTDNKRTIKVMITDNIRPDRSARYPMNLML